MPGKVAAAPGSHLSVLRPEHTSGLGNNPKQFAEANWLGQVLIDADFPGAPPIFLAGIARDDDDPRSGERFVFSHSPSDLVAVHPGQPEIEEDHIGSESRRLGEGPEPIFADVDLVPGGLQQPAEAEGIVQVVLDNQDPPSLQRPVRAEGRPILEGRGPGTVDVVGPDGRESNDDLATAVQPVAPRLDRAAVQFDDRFDQRETDSESSTPAHQRCIDLRERIEDVRQKIRGNPDPRVANRHDEVTPLGHDRDLDPSALRRELEGIRQEVVNDLLEPSRVGLQ